MRHHRYCTAGIDLRDRGVQLDQTQNFWGEVEFLERIQIGARGEPIEPGAEFPAEFLLSQAALADLAQ